MKKQAKGAAKLSRRSFLGSTLTAGAVFSIVPRHVIAQSGQPAPSEKLNLGCVGVGGMQGVGDVRNVNSENIYALCDVDEKFLNNQASYYTKAKKYRDFREMLDKEGKNLDAITITIPDHMHATVALWAMERGLHVHCQKPLAQSVWECRQLAKAARKYKVATQMGNQGHSSEEVRMLCEWIWDGAIGDVHEVHCWTNRPVWPQGLDRPKDTPPVPDTLDWDLWVGPSPMRPYHPTYLPFNWRAWIDFGAGALGDMGCHVMDAAFWSLKLKYPVSVEASHSYEVPTMWTRFENKETYPTAEVVHYQFPAREGMVPVKLHWYDGGILPQRPDDLEPGRKIPESGSIFVGTKGKIMCGTYSENARIIPETKMRAYVRPAKSIPRIENGPGGHEQDWIRACKGGPSASSHFDYSGPFTETVVMGNLAVLNPGKKLEWDGENMKVTNDEEANAYVRPAFREGWSL